MGGTAGPFEPERAHVYTASERLEQLDRLAAACDKAADAFEAGGRSDGDPYRLIAAQARSLSERPIELAELKDLGSSLPPPASWMDPRNPDYNGHRESWQQDAVTNHFAAERAALELRATGTYDQPR